MNTLTAHVFSWAMLACLSAAATSASGAPISFTPLGDLPGGDYESRPTAISADGTVVVGSSEGTRGFEQAFRWTFETGMVGLGDLPGGDFFSEANDISADGSVIVGTSTSAAATREAFRWTAEEGMVGLGNPADQVLFSQAFGVSGDGSIIVGSGRNQSGASLAVRWSAGEGATVIPLNDPAFQELSSSRAWDISADGLVILGTAVVGFPANLPFLGDARGGAKRIEPTLFDPIEINLSADGTTVAGGLFDLGDSRPEAFRWTDVNGLEFLSFPSGATDSVGFDISGDSQVIVGQTRNGSDNVKAAVWDHVNGWESVEMILTDAGVDITGWDLFEATAVSANGRVIAGSGFNPDGNVEAWLAVIAIPEPSTLSLVTWFLFLHSYLFSSFGRRSASRRP